MGSCTRPSRLADKVIWMKTCYGNRSYVCYLNNTRLPYFISWVRMDTGFLWQSNILFYFFFFRTRKVILVSTVGRNIYLPFC